MSNNREMDEPLLTNQEEDEEEDLIEVASGDVFPNQSYSLSSLSSKKSLRAASIQQLPAKSDPKPFLSEEYMSLALGLFWFGLVVVVVVCHERIPTVPEWHSAFPPIRYLAYIVAWASMVLVFVLVHILLAKPIVIWQYLVLLILTVLANIAGNNHYTRKYGFGASVWSIAIGILLRNCLPERLDFYKHCNKIVLGMEFLIKVGVVLMAIDLDVFHVIGLSGLVVAWGETIIVLSATWTVGYKLLKMDGSASIITSACALVCGSSAATAVCGATRGDSKLCNAVITISSVFTIPAIPGVAIIAHYSKMSILASGAWIGGCVDSTGAVAASASIFPEYLQAAIVIKAMQNLLICPLTLIVSTITLKTFQPSILWDKFPKFVLGFLIVAGITTCIGLKNRTLANDVVHQSFIMSELFSNMAFILIGMDIYFKTLGETVQQYKKVFLLYLLAQTVDIATTYLVSMWMFAHAPSTH